MVDVVPHSASETDGIVKDILLRNPTAARIDKLN